MAEGLEIIEVTGRRMLDSEGLPAVEAEVELENGARGRAMVALCEDSEDTDRVMEVLSECVLFEDASDQRGIDKLLEEGASSCGIRKCGGFLTAVSMAVSRAAAAGLGMPLYRYLGGTAPGRLPVPMMTMISGGRYGRNNSLDLESYMVVPVGAASFGEGAEKCMEVYQALKRLLTISGYQTGVGDDGGFVPDLRNSEEALEFILEAMMLCGYEPGKDMCLAIGAGAGSLFDEGTGFYQFKGESRMTGVPVERDRNDMIGFYIRLLDGYPVCAVFDGLAEADADGWGMLTASLGERTQLVGDDVFVTNPSILAEGIAEGVANSILIKLNQIGTVTETLDTIEMAKEAAYTTVVSHRSGETEDSFIADLAVGVNAGQIKTGSLCRSERMAKYNQLLRIEEELGDGAEFFGPMLAEYYALDESED